MKTLIDELSRVTESQISEYGKYHKGRLTKKEEKFLKDFLNSSMDEVRLKNAENYADAVLLLSGLHPLKFFRRAVLRREIFADIDHTFHRDHSAHTLHNYLLGWYVYSCSKDIRDAFKHTFNKKLKKITGKSLTAGEVRKLFGHIWPFLSLAHDLGYLFEGGLEANSTEAQSRKVEQGARIMEDYFNHKLWCDLKLSSLKQRDSLLKLSEVEMPTFVTKSLAGVADSLRNTGDLDELRKHAREELKAEKVFVPKVLETTQSLSRDAFDLWVSYYRGYNSKTMASRVENLRNAYEAYLWDGMPKSGVRLIDHGVASGLLILMADTIYYRFYFGVGSSKPKNEEDSKIWKHIRKDFLPSGTDVPAHWWWTMVVWATAATALHNIQQEPRPWPGCTKDTGKLKLKEDPLAYLGILVDILEEWDRYSMLRRKFFAGDLPIQSKDIRIGVKKKMIVIDYGEKLRAKKVLENLKLALDGWGKIVMVKS